METSNMGTSKMETSNVKTSSMFKQKSQDPSSSYESLLTALIDRTTAVLDPFGETSIATHTLPPAIENNQCVITFYESEILPLLGVRDWPETKDINAIKKHLAKDLILWYKNERPDALYVLTSIFF